jgi:heptosyltransferase II
MVSKEKQKQRAKVIAYHGAYFDIKTPYGVYERFIPRVVPTDVAERLLENGSDWLDITSPEKFLMPYGGFLSDVLTKFDLSKEIYNFDEEIKSKFAENPNILIIRDGAAGDIIMSVPAVRELKKRIPDAKITYATLPCFMDLLNEVKAVDYVVSIHSVDSDILNEYDLTIDWCRTVENYSIERNRGNRIDSFAAHLGLMLENKKTEIYFNEKHIRKAKTLLEQVPKDNIKVGIVLQANSWWRTYPLVHYEVIIKELNKRMSNVTFVLIDTQEICGEYLSEQCKNANIVDLTGKTDSFIEAAAVVGECDIIITPDTGLLHVAGALDIPAVAIFGCISPDVRISTYKYVKAISAEGRCDCSPCFSHQVHWTEKERLINPKRGLKRDCSKTHDVKCMKVISPLEIVDRAIELFNQVKFEKSKYAQYFEKKEPIKRVIESRYYEFATHPENDNYKFSVVIPACADNENCESNIKLINDLNKKILCEDGELIVVANGCCSAFIEYLKKNDIRFIDSKNRCSYSKACNIGAEKAKSDIICFLNSDVIVNDTKWYEAYIEALNDGAVGAVGAEVMQLNHAWCGNGHITADTKMYDFLVGWCVWIKKETLRKIGGWDERFDPYYSEDADLCFKIKYSLGKEIRVIDPQENIIHLGGNTIKRVDGNRKSEIAMSKAAKILSDKWKHVYRPGVGFKDNVAILIPAHVKRSYLVECLDSLRECGLKNKTIYVALDNMEFPERKNYPEVRFYDVFFGNPGKVRNFLVNESVEPIIYFFDADDVLIPDALPALIAAMNDNDADVVYGKARVVDESKNKWFTNIDANGFLNTREYDAFALRQGNYISTQSLVRRSALPSSSPFDTSFPALEDWDLWLTMSENNAKFQFCDIHLWDYRIHDANLTKDAEKNRVANALLIMKHGLGRGANA